MTTDTRSVYENIKSCSPADLPQTIRVKLLSHIGQRNAISKEALSLEIYGKYTSTTDRQIRDAVADLQEAGELICTNSGEGGGYYMAGTADEVDLYLGDISNRIDRLVAKREAMHREKYRRFKSLPKGSSMQSSLF